MERIETKVDKLLDIQITMREDLATIKPIAPIVQKHDLEIRDLQIRSLVTEKMATRKDVAISQVFAVIAIVIAAVPHIISLFKG